MPCSKNILSLIFAILIFIIGLASGIVYEKSIPRLNTRQIQIQQNASTNNEESIYTDADLRFTFVPPIRLTKIEVQNSTIVFKDNANSPWALEISAKKTDAKTTKEWLDIQREGSPSSAGYSLIEWIDASPFGKAIVEKFIVIDQNGNQPIYGKVLQMVYVQNGMLYIMDINRQFQANESPAIQSEILKAIMTFKTLDGTDRTSPPKPILTGPVQYNCELSGGTFKDDRCTCSIEDFQTQEMMYDKNTGFCQSTIGGPAGNAFNASIGLPYGDYSYWTGIVLGICTDSGGSISGGACICPSGMSYSKTSGKCE